ncbi:hypothetical protein CFOL_v3_22864 [Cephalotus follicularis]|uniref:Uncharacterized protein n=1 Tax=Cephalotus follicularis TaxID=3775 RepID=A0A1Q3CGQ1_CEPFO|nr:hypothetical protein CFOL_v3_22864 [Cephalotus follicularis]
MYASGRAKALDDSTLIVRILKNQHNYKRLSRNKNLKAPWLVKQYEDRVRITPKWKLKEFGEIVLIDLNCQISHSATYRARKNALDEVNCSYEEKFLRLRNYVYEILRSNIGRTGQYMLLESRQRVTQ